MDKKEYNHKYYEEHHVKSTGKRGRPKTYKTEEEQQEAKRKYYNNQLKKAEESGVINYEKRFNIRKEGFTCVIGTLNRILLNTCYIEGKVTIVSTEDTSIYKRIREVMLNDVRDWLNSQDMWDRKNKILIVEIPETFAYKNSVKTNTVSFQYNLIRPGHNWVESSCITAWHKLHKGIEPFVEHHYQVIKKAVEDNGTKIAYRLGRLTSEGTASDASQPESS